MPMHTSMAAPATPRSAVSDARRRILLAVTLTHALLILWLTSTRGESPPPKQPTIETYALALPGNVSVPAPRATPEPDPSSHAAVPQATPKIPLLAIAPPAPAKVDAGACAPLEAVQAALLADDAVRAAVPKTPAESRSIAGAIVLWSGGWTAVAATDDAPLATVRLAVEGALAGAPADCMTAPVAGPRLIAVPDGTGTAFLVFGSGTWSWSELFTPAGGEESQARQK